MQNFAIILFIKTLIDSRAKEEEILNYDFFDAHKEEILQIVKMALPSVAEFDSVTLNNYYTTAKNEFLSTNPIDIAPASSLVRKGHKVWLTEERRKIMPRDYIDRYLQFLRQKGRAEKVIQEIDRSSEEILEKLGDPKSKTSFYTKGLVVGNVQSGKTGNFNAVINKAIDAGYSLIIVLSGIMEDLRSQTQERIEEDVVGEGVTDKERDKKGYKGVGTIRRFGERGDANVAQVMAITSYRSDFKKSVKESDFSLNNKNILVCKKNSGVLKNLLIWLNDYLSENKEQHDIPLLIIDDEADNASLNNMGYKGKEEASTINGHIRALLHLFSKRTYLGYTATPFANVLQDRNEQAEGKWPISYKLNGTVVNKEFEQVPNIFPDDFLTLLTAPSNYVGAKQIFETVLEENEKKIPLIVCVADTDMAFPARLIMLDDGSKRPATKAEIEEEHTVSAKREDEFPLVLPESLKEAVQCFILSIAVRLARKPAMANSRLYIPHHTMLIHVSRFIPWQNRTKDLIVAYLEVLLSRIANDFPDDSNSVYRVLERTWDKYYATIVTDIRSYLPNGYVDEYLSAIIFTAIRSLLREAVNGIEVKAVNSATNDKLNYVVDSGGNGKKFIAVGGNRLSRGFTLEGLTINYFIRNTNFSDTLLQMGRWFGYRPGFIDCCKLFTTTDAIEKFDSTTRTIEELEIEFGKMERIGKTPQDFIIRVRKDPGTLKITRPAILKNTQEVRWSYQDKLVQTTKFDLNSVRIQQSWSAFKSFVNKYDFKRIKNDRFNDFYIYQGGYEFLKEFLSLDNAFHKTEISLTPIRKFIEKAIAANKLKNWTIAIKAKGTGTPVKNYDAGFPLDILTVRRSGPKKGSGPDDFNKYRNDFLTNGIFSVSGASANIISGGMDLAVLLSETQIEEAEKGFKEEKIQELVKKEKITREEAEKKVKVPESFPERIYREKMSDQDGLLLVYLMDLKHVFLEEENDPDMEAMVKKGNFNPKVPLIGLAFGFPPIDPDPGDTYVIGKYGIEEEEDEEYDEYDDEINKEEV